MGGNGEELLWCIGFWMGVGLGRCSAGDHGCETEDRRVNSGVTFGDTICLPPNEDCEGPYVCAMSVPSGNLVFFSVVGLPLLFRRRLAFSSISDSDDSELESTT